MKLFLLTSTISILLATSCSKEDTLMVKTDSAGVIISIPYQWKQGIHLSTPVSNSALTAAIYYKGNIVIPVSNGGTKRLLAMINSKNGEFIWKWDDRYEPTEYEDINYYYQFNNLLAYQHGTRGYCINLDDGTTYWKTRQYYTFDGRVNSFSGGKYFQYIDTAIANGNVERVAFVRDISTGSISMFLKANLSSSYISPKQSIGGIIYMNQIPNNDSLLLATYTEPLPNWEINSFLGMYNLYTKKWIYERTLMSLNPTQNTTVFTPPQIYNGKVYANCGYDIVCHDVTTGKQLWSRDFGADFMFSGFIIAENKLIGSCENQMLYCVNPDNGNILWQTKGSGTSSRLAYLNGIVYFVGGGDGKLHAVEVSTGKTVWLLDAKHIDGTIFASYNPVFVFPAEDGKPARVIALTLSHAYCFEAYK